MDSLSLLLCDQSNTGQPAIPTLWLRHSYEIAITAEVKDLTFKAWRL